MLLKIQIAQLTGFVSESKIDPKKLTLVLIHGAGYTSSFWRCQETLRDRFNLIVLNLPGRSDSVDCDATIEDYSVHLQEALDEINVPMILVGHSMGGAVVLNTLLTEKKNIISACIVSSGARLRVNSALKSGGVAIMQQFTQLAQELGFADMMALAGCMAPADTGLNDFMACNQLDLMNEISSISTPCLIMVGENDVLTPVKYSQYLATHIPNSKIKVVAGSGHLLPWDAKNELNSALTELANDYEPEYIPRTP